MAGFDFNTAVELARDMRKRRKSPDDLNERGRSLLDGLQSELSRRGYTSFRDYETKERERVGRNEGLRRSVVSGRERSQALGVEAQAEEDVDEKTKIQKQATRAGRAADITEGILARRTALPPTQGMPAQEPPKPAPTIGRRIGQAVGTAADVVYRNTVGRIPGAEKYLETPVGRQGGATAYALGLATGQPMRYDYEKREVVDAEGNPLRAPTRGNVLQAGAGAAIAEPGRVVSGVRAGRPPVAPKTLPAAARPAPPKKMLALPARTGETFESIPRPMPSRTAPGPSGLEGQNIRDVLLYRHQMVSPQTQRSYRGASVEELNETAKQGRLVRSRRLDPRGEFVTWTTRDPEEALRYSLDPHYGRDVASQQTGAIIESDQHGKFIRGFVVNPAGQIESVVTPGGQARPLSPRGQAGRVPQSPPPAQFSRMRVSQPKPKPVRPDVEPPTQRVVFPMGGGAEPQRVSSLRSTPTIINRVTGTNLGSEMLRVRAIEEPMAGVRDVSLRRLGLPRITDAEDLNLRRVLRGKESPISERVARIARESRPMLDEDGDALVAAGAQVMDQPVRNPTTGQMEPTFRPFIKEHLYTPDKVDPIRIHKTSMPRLQQRILEENPGMPPQVSADIAAGLKARALGREPRNISPEATELLRPGRYTATHLHARVNFKIPDEFLVPMREALPEYIHAMARERAMLDVYGPADQRIRDALKAAADTGHPDADLAIEAWNRFRGVPIREPVAQMVGQITRVLGNTASGMFLGVPTAVKQFTQAAPVLANLPVRKVAVGFVKAFTRQGRFEAEKAGAVIDDLLRDAVQSRAHLPTATTLDRMERFTGRVASKVVKRSGIAWADSFMRTATFHAAKQDFTTLRDAAFRGGRGALAKLQKAGLNETSTSEDIVRAAKRVADELNLRAGSMDMPYILTTPGYAWARQLNSFNIGMSKMIKDRYIAPLIKAARRKDLKTVGEIVASIGKLTAAGTVAGEAVESVLQALQGRHEDRPGGTLREFLEGIQSGKIPSSVAVERMKHDLSTAATLGYLQTIREAMSSYNPQARLYGAGAGAGISNVMEIGDLAREVATAPVGKQKSRAKRQALRGAVRRIPGVGGILAPRMFPSKQ